ncbi:MAG TPA: type II toxin-antitoxin system HicA family toxin [Candidatus Nanoarchaeia archaeon]|nr:type II toxin-antitoxin system HicA family toxin [Candidatus Nanoarchaeia archaeon]
MKLPMLSGEEIVKILKKIGFQEIRQRGSHRYMRHTDGRTTVVPIHSNRDIGRGLLKKILNDVDVTREEFMKYL